MPIASYPKGSTYQKHSYVLLHSTKCSHTFFFLLLPLFFFCFCLLFFETRSLWMRSVIFVSRRCIAGYPGPFLNIASRWVIGARIAVYISIHVQYRVQNQNGVKWIKKKCVKKEEIKCGNGMENVLSKLRTERRGKKSKLCGEPRISGREMFIRCSYKLEFIIIFIHDNAGWEWRKKMEKKERDRNRYSRVSVAQIHPARIWHLAFVG